MRVTSILEGEFAETVAAALADARVTYAITVTRAAVPVSPDPWTPGPVVEADYDCLGFTDESTVADHADGVIEAGDVKVMIVTGSLSITPKPGDTITARGMVYYIVNVAADPARALWSCQARR